MFVVAVMMPVVGLASIFLALAVANKEASRVASRDKTLTKGIVSGFASVYFIMFAVGIAWWLILQSTEVSAAYTIAWLIGFPLYFGVIWIPVFALTFWAVIKKATPVL